MPAQHEDASMGNSACVAKSGSKCCVKGASDAYLSQPVCAHVANTHAQGEALSSVVSGAVDVVGVVP